MDNQDDDTKEQQALKELREQMSQVLSKLTPREAAVLRMRFGIDDGTSYTLDEVALYYNVKRETVRRIEARALRKLRHPQKSRRLADYLE